MTSARISLDQLPAAVDMTRRDQWGRYLIVPPMGGTPEGYTRVTTVAKTLDDGGGLAPWKAAMSAVGIIHRPGLRARWEALIATYDGDPWYASEDSKAQCKALVEDCAQVGGANDRREQGTALHTLTALIDVGRQLTSLTEETERDLNAYQTGLALAGIDIDHDQVELTVVLDEWKVAGTFDRLAIVPGFELPLVGDLKTGADLSYSWQSIAVQLAAYSRGNALYRQGAAADGSQDIRTPMPAVDQNYGLIMWLNAGTGVLELYLVDLRAGWEGFEMSMWARGWRKRKVGMPLAEHNPEDLVPLLAASIADAKAAREEAASEVIDVDQSASSSSSDEPDLTYTLRLRDWLQERIDVIGRTSPAARADLGLSWPPGIPPLPKSAAHSPEDLAAIEAVLDGVETRHEVSFHPPKPTTDPVGQLLHLFPNSTLITEGPAS